MTLVATRSGQSIQISGNTGVDVDVANSHLRSVRITEDAQHVAHFAGHLLHLVEEAKAEREKPGIENGV